MSMRKCAFFAVAGLLSAIVCGCFSVDVVESPVLGGRSGGHAVVCNYGWTLFGCVPLVCGNENLDSWCPLTFFRDEIRPELAHGKLIDLAASRGCDIEDLNLMGDNYVLFDAWYAPVPWVLVYKETNISANLVKRRGEGRGNREQGAEK